MGDISRWEQGKVLTAEEEPGYLKDFCDLLRGQMALSGPRYEDDKIISELVPDEIAAHAADIIEELFERVQNLEYELREARA